MATTVKRSITLDEDLDRKLSERFPPGERSRFINDAAKVALARVMLRELLDEMDAEDPIPPDHPLRAEIARLPLPD